MRFIAANKRFLIALLLASFAASNVLSGQDQQLATKLAALEKLPPTFSFAVLGDNRAGDPACDAVYQKLIAHVAERRPDLVMNTGDQIDKPGNVGHWKRFFESSQAVTAPYFLTVGNHDVHPEVAGSEETYKAQVDLPGNELYYSFVAWNALFIVLDSYRKGEDKKIAGEQFTWLEGVLAASKQKLRFVFVHHPLFPEQGKGKHHGNSLDRYKDDRDRLHALFVKYGVTMVFAGHEHLYLRRTVDGIPYIITGGGGAPLYADDLNGGFYHYVRMTVDGGRVSGEVVDLNGKIRDVF
jgi:3',5'-cyclic AMP phosphodiesterase CpdA